MYEEKLNEGKFKEHAKTYEYVKIYVGFLSVM